MLPALFGEAPQNGSHSRAVNGPSAQTRPIEPESGRQWTGGVCRLQRMDSSPRCALPNRPLALATVLTRIASPVASSPSTYLIIHTVALLMPSHIRQSGEFARQLN